MKRITMFCAACAAVLLASAPAFSQSSGKTMPPVSGPQGNLPGNDSNGSDGTGQSFAKTGNDGSRAQFQQSPVGTGLDLKGPPQTRGPFAE